MAKTLHLRDTIRTTNTDTDSRRRDSHTLDDSDQIDASPLARDHKKGGFRRQVTYLGSGAFRWHGERSGVDRKGRSRGFLRIRRRHDLDT